MINQPKFKTQGISKQYGHCAQCENGGCFSTAVRWVWVSQVLIKTIDVRCGLCGQAEREELKLTPLLDDSHYLERIHQTSAAA